MGEEEMLTVPEVAKILRVEQKTIYRAIKRGEVPGVRRIGRSLRVSRRVLMAWLHKENQVDQIAKTRV